MMTYDQTVDLVNKMLSGGSSLEEVIQALENNEDADKVVLNKVREYVRVCN